MSVILNRFGFFFFGMTHVPPSSSRGGLVLVWSHGVELECFLTTVIIITALCYSDPLHIPWLLSCIYGPLTELVNVHFGRLCLS